MLVSADPFSVVMHRAELRALLKFASQDPSLPHLSCVVLRHDGAFATDGHSLLAGHWREPLHSFEPYLLPRRPLHLLNKAVPNGGGVRITMSEELATIDVVSGVKTLQQWDEAKLVLTAKLGLTNGVQSPPYEAVLEQKLTGGEGPQRFDIRLLSRVSVVEDAAQTAGYSIRGDFGVQIEFGRPGVKGIYKEPSRMVWHGYEQRWTAVVMPVAVEK